MTRAPLCCAALALACVTPQPQSTRDYCMGQAERYDTFDACVADQQSRNAELEGLAEGGRRARESMQQSATDSGVLGILVGNTTGTSVTGRFVYICTYRVLNQLQQVTRADPCPTSMMFQ